MNDWATYLCCVLLFFVVFGWWWGQIYSGGDRTSNEVASDRNVEMQQQQQPDLSIVGYLLTYLQPDTLVVGVDREIERTAYVLRGLELEGRRRSKKKKKQTVEEEKNKTEPIENKN